MDTVLDRIVLLAHRVGLSESEVCRRAGLSETALSQLRRRTAKTPSASMRTEQLASIAAVLGTNVNYLAGTPQRPGKAGRLPNRDQAAEAARLLGFAPRAIVSIYDSDPKDDLPVMVWFRRIELAATELAAASGS